MSDALNRYPNIATVTIMAVRHDGSAAEPATTFELDHDANAEVCEAVYRMMDRRAAMSALQLHDGWVTS